MKDPTGGGGREESERGVSSKRRATSAYAEATPSRSPVTDKTRS